MELLSRTILIQASFLAVCCSTLSYNSGCKSVASRASFLEELSKHWSCSGSEGQFTGSHIDYSFLAWEQSKSRPRTQGFLYGFRMTAQYLFWFAFASLTFLSPTWQWKSLNVGFSRSAFLHRLAAIAALSVYVRTWIASSSFSTETPSLRNEGTTHML